MNCYTHTASKATPIDCINLNGFDAWLSKQEAFVKAQFSARQFEASDGNFLLLLDKSGQLLKIIVTLECFDNLYGLARLPLCIPKGKYQLVNAFADHELKQLALGWGLGAYQFTRYKKASRDSAQLCLPSNKIAGEVKQLLAGITLTRDLVNTPSCDMTPKHLASTAKKIAAEHGAKVTVIQGKKLESEFPAIHAVGKSGLVPPCLIEMTWGNPKHKKVTLVGKGVCFDSGGYDIKPSSGMLLMKKDMGGAAHVLGLAQVIMAQNLKIHLTVLVSAAENLINEHAFRPGDVINTRKGLTVEIGNTDAEGRLVLSDALTYACEKKPDLLIDFATLTGAARVALGPEIATLFSNHDTLASACMKAGLKVQDPCWQLPLFKEYRRWLNSSIADMNNNSNQPFAGAVTAALFLKEFVTPETPWVHLDVYAWNASAQPGRPVGGEAIGLRAVYEMLAGSL